ncbi:MAG: cytochrome c3 family protein [Anaerolineae bacterium]
MSKIRRSEPESKPIGWTRLALIVALSMNVVALGVLSLDHHARTNPRSCAFCHNMEAHVVSYLSSNHLDNIHYQANVGCKDCHTGYSLMAELKSAWRYLRGDYEEVFSQRVFSQEVCNRCHISMEYQANRTDFLVRNPHLSHWPDLVCGDCHLAHDKQIDYCANCHDNGGQRMTGEPIVPRADNPWANVDFANQSP